MIAPIAMLCMARPGHFLPVTPIAIAIALSPIAAQALKAAEHHAAMVNAIEAIANHISLLGVWSAFSSFILSSVDIFLFFKFVFYLDNL